MLIAFVDTCLIDTLYWLIVLMLSARIALRFECSKNLTHLFSFLKNGGLENTTSSDHSAKTQNSPG